MADAARQIPLPLLSPFELGCECALVLVRPRLLEQPTPRSLVERPLLEVAVRVRVALQEERVVAVRRAELDDREAAVDRDVRERTQSRVSALDHQQEVGLDLVQDRLCGVDAVDAGRHEASEIGACRRVVQLDVRVVPRANER